MANNAERNAERRGDRIGASEDGPAAATFALLADDDLGRMEYRAWREAARDWAEYRAAQRNPFAGGGTLLALLFDGAQSAERFWRSVHSARVARGARPVNPPSTDPAEHEIG